MRCIDATGNMLGELTIMQARQLALEQGLDLVEVSPNANPPVCRIMDFGKYRYEERKQERTARKHQHTLALKEIKFHPNVEDHDYQTKLNHIRDFLAKGHKVKISLFYRGRENVHRELGFRLMERVQKDIADVGMAESSPRLIGRALFMMLGVRSAKSGVKREVPKAAVAQRPATPVVTQPAPAAGNVTEGLPSPVPAQK